MIPIENRDAYATIRGYFYQIDLTVRAWLSLKANQLLLLENGEDIDCITKGIEKEDEESIILEQIKHLEDVNITLRRGEFIESLVNFKTHQENNPTKNLSLRFTTNTSIGKETINKYEKNGSYLKEKGLEVWKQIYAGTLSEISTDFMSVVENIKKILLDNETAKKKENKSWFTYIEAIPIEDFVKNVIKKVEIADATISFGEDIENALLRKIKTVFGYDKDDAETFLHQLRIYVFKKLSQKGLKQLCSEDLEILSKNYEAKTLDKDIRLSRILHSYYDKINEKLDRIDNKLNTISNNQNERFNNVDVQLATMNSQLQSMQLLKLDKEDVNKKFSLQIDDFNKFIDDFNYEKALEHLLSLEKHHFEYLNSNNRYRILVNIGLCYSHLDKVEESAYYFIKIKNIGDKTAKEFGIVALGYALLKQPIETNTYIDLAIKKDAKCVFAYVALIAIEDLTTPLETLIQKIPTDIHTDIEICHAISVFASRKGQHKEAKKWLQIALNSLPNTNRSKISLQTEYAVAGMRLIMEEYNYALLSNQFSTDILKEIQEYYTIFDNAWQTFSTKVANKETNMWLLNRGICNKYLGNIENAYQDLKQVAEIEKDDLFTQRQYLFLIYESGRIEEAIQKAKQLYLAYPQEHELVIIKCQFYIGSSLELSSYIEECITDLEKAISQQTEQKILVGLYHFLSFFLMEKNDINLILDLIGRLQKHLTDILICIDLLKLYAFLGDKNNYDKSVPLTLQLLNEKVEVRNIIMLFNDLRINGYHKEAIQVIENCNILNQNTDLNCQLVESHLQLKNYAKALSICQKLRNVYDVEAKTYFYEADIYDNIGESQKAEELAELFIHSQIDTIRKLPVMINLAYNYMKQSNVAKLNSILPLLEKEWKENYKLEIYDLFKLSAIYIFIGNIDKGLEIAYTTRNLHLTVNDAHFKYCLICQECYNKTQFNEIYAKANIESIYFLEDNDTRVFPMFITPRAEELTYEILWECFEKSNFDVNKPPFCNRVRYLQFINQNSAISIAIRFIKRAYIEKTSLVINVVLQNLLLQTTNLSTENKSNFLNLLKHTISYEFRLLFFEYEDIIKRLNFFLNK